MLLCIVYKKYASFIVCIISLLHFFGCSLAFYTYYINIIHYIYDIVKLWQTIAQFSKGKQPLNTYILSTNQILFLSRFKIEFTLIIVSALNTQRLKFGTK